MWPKALLDNSPCYLFLTLRTQTRGTAHGRVLLVSTKSITNGNTSVSEGSLEISFSMIEALFLARPAD